MLHLVLEVEQGASTIMRSCRLALLTVMRLVVFVGCTASDDALWLRGLYVGMNGRYWTSTNSGSSCNSSTAAAWSKAVLTSSEVPPAVCSGLTGVTCDSNGRVTELNLIFCNLTGTLPDVSGHAMSQLQKLLLYYNDITGTLPASWLSLRQLIMVAMQGNRLTGSLPDSWSSLSNMQQIDVSSNQLQARCRRASRICKT